MFGYDSDDVRLSKPMARTHRDILPAYMFAWLRFRLRPHCEDPRRRGLNLKESLKCSGNGDSDHRINHGNAYDVNANYDMNDDNDNDDNHGRL